MAFFVSAGLAVLVLAIVVPTARLVLVVVLAVEALAVAWYRWRNSSRALRRRGLPPGRLAIPLCTPFLEAGFYRRQWNRYGPIYTTNMLYKPTVAVGGIELGRRILREHRDELRPPAFSDGDRVEGSCVRNQVGERHRAESRRVHAGVRPEHGGGRASGDGSCRQASPCDLVGGERRFRPAGSTDSLPPGAPRT